MSIPAKNNFDHIRLFLAVGVFLFHTAELTQLPDFTLLKSFINVTVAVHSFFIVSGFLIFMSYERSSSLKSYFSKRIRRIVPAYITVVLILFITLSLLSELSIINYFTATESWTYLFANLTTLNFLQPTLPGVFENNYLPAIDGSLWTIKVEVAFYLSVPLIAYFYRWIKPNILLMLIFMASALYFYVMGYLAKEYNNALFYLLQHQLPGQLLFFSGGALLYYQFNMFKRYQHLIFAIAFLVYLSQSVLPIYPLYALSLSIIVIYLATAIKQLGHIAKHGDLSYGIYIWHFPIIQIFIALGLFTSNVWLGFTELVLVVFSAAWLSWHYIEKPFLSKKSHYVKEDQEL